MRFNLCHASRLYHRNRISRPKLYRWYMTHFNAMFYREAVEKEECFVPSPEWNRAAYAKLLKLSHILKDIDQSHGRLINITNSIIITDPELTSQMNSFNSIARSFLSSQKIPCLGQPNQIKPITLNSLKTVADLLSITAQQRKLVRTTISPQITQHHIWRGALLEVLKDVKHDIYSLECQSNSLSMAEQIVATCTSFFSDTANASSPGSPSWVKLAPIKKFERKKKVENGKVRYKWEEVVEMFVDLTECLSRENALWYHATKLETMIEGLKQIRDVVIERDVNHKEAWQQDCSIRWKLTNNLGHSSKCLFTLLQYYLYGSVRDIQVEVYGGGLRRNGKKLSFCVGKVLTSDNEDMVLNGVRQLSRVLGVFKFVWETAGATSEAELELHGHLWCIGAKEKVIKHRGYDIHLHPIRL